MTFEEARLGALDFTGRQWERMLGALPLTLVVRTLPAMRADRGLRAGLTQGSRFFEKISRGRARSAAGGFQQIAACAAGAGSSRRGRPQAQLGCRLAERTDEHGERVHGARHGLRLVVGRIVGFELLQETAP